MSLPPPKRWAHCSHGPMISIDFIPSPWDRDLAMVVSIWLGEMLMLLVACWLFADPIQTTIRKAATDPSPLFWRYHHSCWSIFGEYPPLSVVVGNGPPPLVIIDHYQPLSSITGHLIDFYSFYSIWYTHDQPKYVQPSYSFNHLGAIQSLIYPSVTTISNHHHQPIVASFDNHLTIIQPLSRL